ncbi:CmcJ/NvfI family oxidoreductase [Actinomadura parmotrematis]|uniref:Methyltransferase n=1 Tax=Actinomadura parmotrematis TaxID=2864039 RepID=A0ABS7FLL4_9ACTN|nr:CmcJ/NvfI family oxidoreductase [Actinomadura parmotrematis]MBW8481261.1 hypothetical protein [Actinomadura parmotrematis]
MSADPVQADIYYAGPFEGRGRIDLVEPARGNIAFRPYPVRIHDARPLRPDLSLDREGFVLADREIAAVRGTEPADGYAAELAGVIRELTGASAVLPQANWNVLRRTGDPAERGVRPRPALFSHLDYTARTAETFLGHLRDAEGARVPRDFDRFAIYQTWQVLSDPPQDSLLALTDGRTVPDAHTVSYDNLIGPPDHPGNVFESRLVRHSEEHRWYYFPDMRSHELLVFVGHDSGRPVNVLHSAFPVPGAGPDARPRISLEARFFAFFG